MTLGYRVQNSECEVDCLPADKKIEQAANPLIAKGVDKKRWINRQIALIDEAICEQLNVILHEPRFQALESAWRGLVSLIEACDMLGSIKIRFLDVSWHDLSRDFERAPDFDQSRLFHLVYNEEFGSPGGEPYSVLLGDYQVAHRPYEGHPYDDVHTLQGIAQVAAASFSPFVCGAAAQLFGLDRFEDLGARIDFDVIFKQEEYIRWRSLRSSTDSRFLAVTLPGVLMRQPYCHHFSTGNGLRFKEEVGGPDGSRYLWGNAAYAFGGVLINAFSSVGWFTHIRGVASDELAGGLVSNFAAQSYRVDSTPVAYKILTPVLITDDTERSLSELGFIALCHCYQTPYAAFQNCPSIQKPKDYRSKAANANARISAMLQHVLCGSRFAQYIKIMVRDKVGSYISASHCERMLQKWLDRYCSDRDDLSWDMKARYPLREARVNVKEEPGSPGIFKSIIYLKTHYTANHLVSEIKLTTTLNQLGMDFH